MNPRQPKEESRPFRMDRPRRPFQLTNPTSSPRAEHCTCQTCGDSKPDDGAMNCENCRNNGKRRPSQYERVKDLVAKLVESD